MAKTSTYGASNIQVLEGLEAIRKRPAMYIGSTDQMGLHHIFTEILDNAVDEAIAGFCNHIWITINKDGSITVKDNGRGIPIEIHPQTKVSTLETVMTNLHAGGKFDQRAYKISGGLHGVGMKCTNALSEWMETIVWKDGGEYKQEYKRGIPQYPVKKIGDLFKWCRDHGMSKNYPTYIRRARRKGVKVEFSKEKKDWDLFHTYLKLSGENKGFEVKSKQYYINMWKYLSKDSDILRLGIARQDNRILAMIVIAVYGDEVSTLYSAQTDRDSNLRSTMLLRWECMLLGQKEGIKRFNNWGVLPDKKYEDSNPGYGYSHYKRSFGGYLESIERTYEYPYKKILHLFQRVYDWYIKIRYYRFR